MNDRIPTIRKSSEVEAANKSKFGVKARYWKTTWVDVVMFYVCWLGIFAGVGSVIWAVFFR